MKIPRPRAARTASAAAPSSRTRRGCASPRRRSTLHGSVGPARTTISAVAERAGVQRATVYRHFPDEEALFGACSAHWIAANPLPDLAGWAAVEDPDERLRSALSELYAWYDRAE